MYIPTELMTASEHRSAASAKRRLGAQSLSEKELNALKELEGKAQEGGFKPRDDDDENAEEEEEEEEMIDDYLNNPNDSPDDDGDDGGGDDGVID